jgi:hypothetical protein
MTPSRVHIRRWWLGVVVALVVAAGCAEDKPKRSDVDRAALVVYPGATVQSETWNDAIDDDYIDTGGQHLPARLSVTWDMGQKATVEEVITTISEELVAMGWTPDPQYASAFSLRFFRTQHGNSDELDLSVNVSLDVPNGSDPSENEVVAYSIDYLP